MPEDTVRTVGRYGILREIGRGGMGIVYLARQLDLDRLVALKEMAAFHAADPALARRFVRESRLAGSVVHANVVTVFDYFEHAGTPYIAMELVEGGSLRPYVGDLAPAQIGGVLEGLLAGLGAAEQRGIVHRDLKPENLMVTSDGRVKIADFGIAKATQTTRTSAFVTATGTTIGTPQYMAPEQAMARDIGPWTDLYSAGCIAYELFAGAPPFHDADTPMAIMLRHINDPLPPVAEVAGVSRDISDWVERLTAKDRHARPQTANDAWEALEEVLIAELGPRWRRESRLPEPPSRPATTAPTSSEYRSFAWEPTSSTEIAGIDVEGTGPDTGGDILPTAPTTDAPAADTAPPTPVAPTAQAPGAETATPPTADAPAPTAAAETPTPPAKTSDAAAAETAPPAPRTPATGVLAAETVPRTSRTPATGVLAAETVPPTSRTPATGVLAAESAASPAPPGARLAVAGAIGVFAAVLLPLVAMDMERWNVFAVLGPLEAAGTALATLTVAHRLRRSDIAVPLAAGILIALGSLSTVAALALAKFVVERLDPAAVILVVVTAAGALAILAAGIACLRAGPEAPAAADPATIVLGFAGTALACVALFVNYDGFSSLWSEVPEIDSAEFFFEPFVAVVTMLVGLVLLGSRPRFAAGLLLAAGGATALHYADLIIAAAGGIGEPGEIRAAGFIGVVGSLLVAASAALAARSRVSA